MNAFLSLAVEALNEPVVVGVDGQLGERKRLLSILFFSRSVNAGDCERLVGGHSDGPANVRGLLPIWLEETDHRDKTKLRFGPCGLVGPELANGLCAGVHCRQTLPGSGVEPVVAGHTRRQRLRDSAATSQMRRRQCASVP